MEFSLGLTFLEQNPGILFGVAVILFVVTHIVLRWPLPLAFITVAVITALLGDYGIPFRHLVEGGFGFINLALALFAGAFFGHMMRRSGAADAAGAGMVRLVGGNVPLVLALAAIPVFVVGMYVGLSGVAVLSAGVFALPALRRIGYDDVTIAAFIAVMATAGMIAPPMNVPGMLLADGVNMPWTGVTKALFALAIPLALMALAWFSWGLGPKNKPAESSKDADWGAFLLGILPLVVMVVIWVGVRVLGNRVIDPASPLILVIGGLVALPMLPKNDFRNVIDKTFTGVPLLLAAVLVTVGIMVQIMTLTGVRGWLVITTMSQVAPWNFPSIFLAMPLIGGALTSMVVADVIGVPAAFSFIGQDMIINMAALSGVASLAEFVPPTAIAAALSCYVVGGDTTVGKVFRKAWPPMLGLAILSLLMLLFAKNLSGILT